MPPVCGFARTATIRAAWRGESTAVDLNDKRLSYYDYVASGRSPTIVVIQDLDHDPGVGAFWGEVQTNIHKGLGVLGAITNGSFRDINDSAKGFNLIGGKVSPSHAFVHLVDIDCLVTVHGLSVFTDDIIHMDHHGAVIIPAKAVKLIPSVVETISRREKILIKAAQSEDFNIDKLRAALGQRVNID